MKAPLRRSDEECDGSGACDQQLAVLCRRPRLPLMNLCKLLIWRQGGKEGDEDQDYFGPGGHIQYL